MIAKRAKLAQDVENKRRVFSRMFTGRCDLSLVDSKLSWSLVIDHEVVTIDVKSLWGYC